MTGIDENLRQHHALERIHTQANLRGQHREAAAAYDAEAEQVKGDNERNAMRLQHDLDIENRQLDLQFQAYRDGQQIRLESLQTAIKQHDDYFRHFWELDKDILALEGRIAEKIIAAGLQQGQTRLDHQNAMESKTSNQGHEITMEAEKRVSATHDNELDKDNFEFKERLRLKLAREHGQLSRQEVADIMARMDKKP